VGEGRATFKRRRKITVQYQRERGARAEGEGMGESPKDGRPYISVIVVAHRKTFLSSAVRSALGQTLPRDKFEVIVAKDFEDLSLEDELREEGVRVLTADDVSPGGKALAALSASRGEVISFLDDDDEFLPGKLEAVFRAFSSIPSLDYYHNGIVYKNAAGRVLGSTSGPQRIVTKEKKAKYARYLSKVRADFNSSSISIRKTAIDAGLIGKAKYMVDTLYLFSALVKGRDILVDGEPLTAFRLHADQTDRALASPVEFRKRRALTFYRYCGAANALAQAVAGTPYASWAREILAKRRLQLSLFADAAPPLPKEYLPRPADSLIALKPKTSVSATLNSVALALAPFAPKAARLAYASRSFMRATEEIF